MEGAEDSFSFFGDLVEAMNKSSLSYELLLSAANNLFKPEKFLQRAQTAAQALLDDGLTLDHEAIERNIASVKSIGLTATIAGAVDKLIASHKVLTPEAVDRMFRDDPEYERLRELANGCPVPKPPGFVPNYGRGVSMRTNADADPSLPLLIHAIKDAAAGNCIIVPLETAKCAALAEGVPLHVSERFLRDKDSDPLGRPIPDYSHSAHGTPPNHDELKPVIAQKWGDVTHPDISDVARAMNTARAATPVGRVWGSRVDVKAAYTRIALNPCDAPMLATLVAVDHPRYGTLVSIPIVNQWGAQIAGHAYEVLGRALTRRADARTATEHGRTGVTYVDDRVQFGSRQVIMDEVDNFAADARAAMGDAAINDAKTVTSTRLDTIGWRCDTIQATVAPSPRAVLKLIYVFNVLTAPGITPGSLITVRQLQKLSSLAIRYSRAIVPLRPFSAAFAKNAGGPHTLKSATRHLSRAAFADILAWRRMLELGSMEPQRLSVKARWLEIDGYPPERQAAIADVRVWVDAQGGGGIGVYAPGTAWDGCKIADTTYFKNGIRDQLSNNVLEFFSIIGIAVVAQAHRNTHLHVYTDNTAVLSWAQKQRDESGFHTLLLRVLCDVQVATGIQLTASHVAGAANVHADAISRNFNVPSGQELKNHVESTSRRARIAHPLWMSFNNVLATPSPTPLEIDHAVRTALELVTGTNSAPSTRSPN